jgi:hypothetical protein
MISAEGVPSTATKTGEVGLPAVARSTLIPRAALVPSGIGYIGRIDHHMRRERGAGGALEIDWHVFRREHVDDARPGRWLKHAPRESVGHEAPDLVGRGTTLRVPSASMHIGSTLDGSECAIMAVKPF